MTCRRSHCCARIFAAMAKRLALFAVFRMGIKNDELVFKKIEGKSPGRLDARDPIIRCRRWKGAVELQHRFGPAQRHRELCRRRQAVYSGAERVGLLRRRVPPRPLPGVRQCARRGNIDRLLGRVTGHSSATVVRLTAAAMGALMFLTSAGAGSSDEIPNVTDPEMIQAGRKLFVERHCAYCHGSEGNGGVKLAARDDLEPISVFETIADGRVRGNLRMPAWRGVLSDTEIWQATAYVLALSRASK